MIALSRVAATASGGLWRNPRHVAGGRCGHHALVVDGQHRVERAPTMKGHDGLTAASTSARGTTTARSPMDAGQGLTMFGADHDVDPETSGGGNEVRGPVGGRGQQQEDPGHPPMMVATHQD